MSSKRTARFAHQLRDEISQLIQTNQIKDPRIGFVTIAGVRISKDFRHAKVFVSVYGTPEEATQSIDGLKNAQGYVRRLLLKRLHVKRIPELQFVLDNSIEEGIRMSQLINNLPAPHQPEEQGSNGSSDSLDEAPIESSKQSEP